MSIVVWDGQVLATDQAASDEQVVWKSQKAWYHEDERGRVILSGVGPLASIIAMREWYKAGATDPLPSVQLTPSFCHLLVVTREKGLLRFEQVPHPIEHGFQICAFGEGRAFALGAMAVGAPAVKAVAVANTFSPHCGLGVAVYNLEETNDEEDRRPSTD